MTTTNTTLKLAALIAAVGIVAMSFAFTPAHAQTTTTTTTSTSSASTAQLLAEIAALQAQIAALQAQLAGGATVATYTRDLTIGSRGTDVVALQTFLISKGFLIPAGPTGFFGTQTRAALAAFQAANGISPAAGFFGPITRGRLASLGAGTGTGGTSVGPLQGGAGQLRNVDMVGDVESDLHEGDAATKVIGFSADANGSDIAVQRVDATFTISGTSGSSNIDRYVDSVSIYQDGTKLATMDASAGDKNGRVWTFRFSDLNGVIREGHASNFYVEVTPVNSVGSAESGVTLTAAIPTDGIRAVDAEGVSETYTPSGTLTQDFTVSTATTGTLSLTEGSDNPTSTVIQGDANTSTDNVTLLAFNLRARNQDITVNDLPITLTATGTTNVGDIVQSVSLMQGGTTLKTKSIGSNVGSTTTIVFDNVDRTISSDSSEGYTVEANIRSINTGTSTSAFTNGDAVTASVASNSPSWDVEDQNGNTVTPTGTVTGGSVSFQTIGISVTKVDATATKSAATAAGTADTAQYAITFKVTAGDDDLYIARSIVNSSTPTASAVTWATTTSSTAGVTGASAANLSATDTNGSDTSTVYKVPAGTSRTFTLNVTLTATATGFTGVQLTGIGYGTTPTTDSIYSAGLDTFRTQDVSMTTH